ncbi:MAG: alpha/beta fold hydrolase [Chloroflexi bacterium]|nr:alpha/beta fold hydrolase [Chloroflexota bacterium]
MFYNIRDVIKPAIRVGIILFLLAGLGQVVCAQESAISGQWVGGFNIEGEWTLVIVGFDDQGDGGYLVQDGHFSALIAVRLEASSVHFETAALAFDGELAEDTVSGHVVQAQEHGDFYLARLTTMTTDAYTAYIGNYQSDLGRLMLVARSDGVEHLFYMDSGRQVILFPLAENGFLSAAGEEITFVRNAQAHVTGLTIHQVLAPLAEEQFLPRVKYYREEDVRFSSGDVVLAGTLLMPPTERPHPAVILIHGAGAAERQLYRIFADHFARQGIAALIYDKRGSGNSTGNRQAATLDDLAADALAGVRFLTSHLEVNPAQVGVWGFSQGGRVAPMVAARLQDVSFVIVGSAPGVSWNQLELWRRDKQYLDAGYPERVIEMGLKYAKLSQDWERLLDRHSATEADLAPTSFWTRIEQPTCALYGLEDEVVPPGDSAVAIAEALDEAGNRDYTVVVFPEADHNLLVDAATGSAFAPGLTETTSSWILERTDDQATFGKDQIVQVVPALDATGEFDATGRYGSRPWYGWAVTQLLLILFFVLIFLFVGVGWPLSYLLRRWRGGKKITPGRLTSATFLAGLVSCLNLMVLVGLWGVVLTVVVPDNVQGISSYNASPLLHVLPWLASFAVVITLVLPFSILRVWQDDTQSTARRGHYLLVTLAALGFIWFASYWNILGFRF